MKLATSAALVDPGSTRRVDQAGPVQLVTIGRKPVRALWGVHPNPDAENHDAKFRIINRAKVTNLADAQAMADLLGNTPAVCRSDCFCPEILPGFEKGRVINHFFRSPDELISCRGRGLHLAEQSRNLHVAEKSLLAFMK